MSLNEQIIQHLEGSGTPFTTAELAAALGVESKKVSSALSKLVKAEKIRRDDQGRVYALIDTSYMDEEAPSSTPADEDGGPATFKPGDKTVNIDAWKRKITALLAKAERTDNDHERDAFTAAAERLMLKLGIHHAELEAVGEVKKEKIVEVSRVWKGNYSIALIPFTGMVADGFGHIQTLQSTRNACHRTSYIIGPESQVEEFCRLLDSLVLQVMPALHRWQKENREARRYLTDMEKFIQHRSFITGFGQQVGDRLWAARKMEEKEMSTGAELVVANRDSEVSDWIKNQYPVLGKARGMKYGDAVARQAGREAGKKATLNSKAVANPKAVAK